jgi:hypothetical protein
MESAGLDLTVDGDISDFLGVNIRKDKDGTVHLTQPHLIEQVLKELRLGRAQRCKEGHPSGEQSTTPPAQGSRSV